MKRFNFYERENSFDYKFHTLFYTANYNNLAVSGVLDPKG